MLNLVRNRCIIEVFGGVCRVVTLIFVFSVGERAFCHRTESDLFLFILAQLWQRHFDLDLATDLNFDLDLAVRTDLDLDMKRIKAFDLDLDTDLRLPKAHRYAGGAVAMVPGGHTSSREESNPTHVRLPLPENTA